MASQYIIYILFSLWLIHITQRIFYCVYFWQLKEYRFDRIKGDAKKSLKVFFPKTAIVIIVVLILFPFFLIFKNLFSWDGLVLIIFCLFGVYSIFLLSQKRWKMPKPTKKAVFLLFLSITLLLCCLAIFISKLFLFIVFVEIVLPLATFLITEILQIPTFFIKRIVYKKAKNKIGRLEGITVIGITGSYGKSSTKEFLYTILSKKYKVLSTSGNTNTEIGVAQTVINKLKPEHRIFIVEMGAYKKGEIKLLCDIVKPKIGVVTGVNEQHLALFGSLNNLLSAEGGLELAKSLPEDGTLVLNGDNKYCLDLYKKTRPEGYPKKRVYSITGSKVDSDIWTDQLSVHEDHISFLSVDKNKRIVHFRINVLGEQNVQNVLAAVLVAKELGMSLEEIAESCKYIRQSQAGITLKKGRHGINVIDSSYSSNPDGVIADLKYLSIFPNKRVVIMPCLIELGEKSEEIHEKIGRKIAEICDLAIITSKDRFKTLKMAAVGAGMKEKDILFCENPNDIYSIITLFCKSGDAVLLEGRVPSHLITLL